MPGKPGIWEYFSTGRSKMLSDFPTCSFSHFHLDEKDDERFVKCVKPEGTLSRFWLM